MDFEEFDEDIGGRSGAADSKSVKTDQSLSDFAVNTNTLRTNSPLITTQLLANKLQNNDSNSGPNQTSASLKNQMSSLQKNRIISRVPISNDGINRFVVFITLLLFITIFGLIFQYFCHLFD